MKKKKEGSNWRHGVRDGFDRSGNVICEGCFQKKVELDELKEEVRKLRKRKFEFEKLRKELKDSKKELRRLQGLVEREQPVKGDDGAHVPPSQKRFKKKSLAENVAKRGGGRKGHKGHGRSRFSKEQADKVIHVSAPEVCPDCQQELEAKERRERMVLELEHVPVQKLVYQFERKKCPRCRKVCQGQAPLAPRALYGNGLLAKALVMHFEHGTTIGTLCNMFGAEIKSAGLIAAFHRISSSFQKAIESFQSVYRHSKVKHADETGWRIDGQNGWAWLFCSPHVSLLQHELTRSQSVVQKVMGNEELPGVLVVDRYNGYNRAPCSIQYCYAHLLREVKKLKKDFPDATEVLEFTDPFAGLLTEAMKIGSIGYSHKEYRSKARDIVQNIKALVAAPAKHQGIVSIQNIFSRRKNRLYQWARSPNIPAHNNYAEREIRKTVIARKMSCGSQSENGALTRSIITSVLATAKKNLAPGELEPWIYDTLNELNRNSDINIAARIPFPKQLRIHIH